jgi:hypothetical protein
MVLELGWQTRARRKKTGSEFRAPSWSWAAVDNPAVIPADFDYTPFVEIRDAKVTLATNNPFSQVTSGYVKIECHLVKGRVPLSIDEQMRGKRARNSHLFIGEKQADYIWYSADTESDELEVYCMPLYSYIHGKAEWPAVKALALKKTREKGTYQRLGSIYAYGEWRDHLVAEALDFTLDTDEFLEKSDGSYLICIK